MRVLFITAYYPPCNQGWGYMRICEQVADGLSALGHDIAILTSTCGNDNGHQSPYPIHRLLKIDPDWTLEESATRQFFVGRKERERQGVESLYNIVDDFQPDIIFVWHANGLSRLLLQTAENFSNIVTVYYFANYFPEFADEYINYWTSSPRNLIAKVMKWPLALVARIILAIEGKPITLKYEHSISVSDYVRRRLVKQGLINSKEAIVIPNGVDFNLFALTKDQEDISITTQPLKCIIAGRVSPEKGIHTVLQAFALLHQQGQLQNIHLTIIGDGPEGYKEELRQFVSTHNLEQFVYFESPVSIEEMPNTLTQHDILLLPSEWDEPLACIMLEAMASNLLVVGTTTGGSGEALFHDRTGLVFEPGDPESLATQLARILNEPGLVPRLAQSGRQEVVENFDIQGTIKRIEDHLLNLVSVKEKVG